MSEEPILSDDLWEGAMLLVDLHQKSEAKAQLDRIEDKLDRLLGVQVQPRDNALPRLDFPVIHLVCSYCGARYPLNDLHSCASGLTPR